MNEIPQLQNAAPQQRLMRARQQTYVRATRLLMLQFGLTVVLPVAAAQAALFWPNLRPVSATALMVITVLDVTVIDRLQRRHLKLAARISEAFDCHVLTLPWNGFVAGKPVDPEVILEAATAWRGKDADLIDWYPPAVGKAPLHLARIICQRANLRYDATLRRNYGVWLVAGAVALVLLLLAAAYKTDLSVESFFASVLAPAAPILIWALREAFRQSDTAEAQEALKGDAESLWERAKTGDCKDVDCEAQSREFQNAIFARRVSSPLIFPGIYKRLRPGLEDQMNQSADVYLAQIGIK